MDRELIGWLSLASLFLFIGLGVPVAFVLGALGLVGYLILAGSGPALAIVPLTFYGKTAVYAFTAVPLFILMGHFAYHSGFGADVYNVARRWVSRIPGGLAQATIVGAAAFGACCGSGLAACAMLTKVTVPEMVRHGYDKKLAYGCVATAGPIAQMIPPSIMFVLYGVITETSVAKLLMAGIFPGLICAALYMITVYILTKINPSIAPVVVEKMQWRSAFISLKGVWGVAALGAIVMGGIYTGVFTPTEAGAIGAFGGLVLGLAARRLKWKSLTPSFLDTARTTSMIYLIMAGAYVYGYLLAATRLPFAVSTLLTSMPVAPIVVLLAIMAFYLVIGCFMDMVPAMFITLPIIFPAIKQLGFDPIWFGVLMVQQGEISLVTPPFGLNLFIMKGIMPDADMSDIVRGVIPFVIAAMITLGIYIAFPQVALFLPNRMLGG